MEKEENQVGLLSWQPASSAAGNLTENAAAKSIIQHLERAYTA